MDYYLNTTRLNTTQDLMQRNSLMLKITPCDSNNKQNISCEQDPEKINNFLKTDHYIAFLVSNMVPNFDSLN